jgi:hypothetical protein
MLYRRALARLRNNLLGFAGRRPLGRLYKNR